MINMSKYTLLVMLCHISYHDKTCHDMKFSMSWQHQQSETNINIIKPFLTSVLCMFIDCNDHSNMDEH